MKKLTYSIVLLLVCNGLLFSQVAINTDGSAPDESAGLDVKYTDKGFLPPRITGAKRDAILNPAAGLIVWFSDCGASGELQVFNGTAWTNMIGEEAAAHPWLCGNPFVDLRDEKSYATILIGTQCWMAENLNVGNRINGDIDQGDYGLPEKYCCDDLESNCDIYGGPYQWDEMMQYTTQQGSQGICFTGWHVPADAEWTARK